jgi:hypothetical protein
LSQLGRVIPVEDERVWVWQIRPYRLAYTVLMVALGGYLFGWKGAALVTAALIDIVPVPKS